VFSRWTVAIELVLAACDPAPLSRSEPTAKQSACLPAALVHLTRDLPPKRSVKVSERNLAAPSSRGVVFRQATQGRNRIYLHAPWCGHSKQDISARIVVCSAHLVSLLAGQFSLLYSASHLPCPTTDRPEF
jgi:hypothetical protein